MKYISTRDKNNKISFSQAVLEGLASDGGLIIPDKIPDFSNRLNSLKGLSYQSLALEIFKSFIDDEIEGDSLAKIIEKSYSTFKHKNITPVNKLADNFILELYHGPTLAFKDVALQFLGNLFEYLLKKENQNINILGATSGDTGSAAINGIRGKDGINIFMLHPQGRVSEIQEKQMTTIIDKNVVNIAIKGSFDDAQRIVKEIFNDLDFKYKYRLGAVNSINWARIMAQIVYYFYAAFSTFDNLNKEKLVFSVPTGNFGDIYAGYIAKKMGLPIDKLILATNENDILFQCLQTGSYQVSQVKHTYSPSMDIQVSSNFERYLFDLFDKNTDELKAKINDLSVKSGFKFSKEQLKKAQAIFLAKKINNEECLDCIRRYSEQSIILDPHTAVGVVAAEQSPYKKVICLSTAHPAKFGIAIKKATGKEPEMPTELKNILNKESKCIEAKADVEQIKEIILSKLK